MDKQLSDYISMVIAECDKTQIKPNAESILDAAVKLMTADKVTMMLDKIVYGNVYHPGALRKSAWKSRMDLVLWLRH